MRTWVLLLSSCLFLTACFFGKTFVWNSELTLHIRTPDGPVAASSVTRKEFWVCDRACIRFGGTAFGREVYGEAVAAQLGSGTLFALLNPHTQASPGYVDAFADRGINSMRGWARAIMRNREVVAEVPRKFYPRLIAFEDITDPTSIFEVDPDNLATVFGPGYALERITVIATDKPLTTGVIDAILPWVDTIGPNLTGGYAGGDQDISILARTTGGRHFKRKLPE
ncbi:MAG: hypothetical protein AAGL96_19035 [Pseudomonadota bacterium]